MKLNRVFVLACAASAALLSCGKESVVSEDALSSFKVASRLLTVDADGGTSVMDYGISGAKEGQVAEVSSGADWLKVGMVFNSSFSYTVDPNESGADRETSITLSCSGVKTLKISVLQSRRKEDKPIFSNYEISVTDVTTSTARIRVTPVDAGKTYLYAVVRKSDFDRMTEEEYIQARIQQIKDMLIMYPGTVPSSYLSRGPVDTDNLRAEQRPSFYDRTDYYVTAFDLSFNDADGTASYSGKVDRVQFRSATATASDMNLALVQKDGFVTVSSDSSDGYVCDVMTLESWNEFSHPDDAAHLYISTASGYNLLEVHSGTFLMDLEDALVDGPVKGQTYVAFAVGYRDSATDGGLTTEVKYITFTY